MKSDQNTIVRPFRLTSFRIQSPLVIQIMRAIDICINMYMLRQIQACEICIPTGYHLISLAKSIT